MNNMDYSDQIVTTDKSEFLDKKKQNSNSARDSKDKKINNL